MHLLATKAGGFVDDEGIIDLQQSPADIVILSSQDSTLALLSHVSTKLGGNYPSVRLANVIHLLKPAAFDLYDETVLKKAKLIIISLLGGKGYWFYGIDQLQTLCRLRNIPLIVVPGDNQADEELFAVSSVKKMVTIRVWRFLREGGEKNVRHLFHFLGQQFFKLDLTWQEPQVLPLAWIYYPNDKDNINIIKYATLKNWQQRWQKDQPIALLLFYRSHVQSANTQVFNELIKIMQQYKLNPLPIVVSSLKENTSLALVNLLCQKIKPDVILNTTSFAMSSHVAGNNNNNNDKYNKPLFQSNAPVLQLILASNDQEDWQKQPLGLRARDLAMNVVLPEMDGRIITRAVSFKKIHHYDDKNQIDVVQYQLHPERAKFCIALAVRWAMLNRKKNKNKRIALILANYPIKDGRIGNGVGLDTPASTIQILNAMQTAGYPIENIPHNGNALIQALLQHVTNNPARFHLLPSQQSLSLKKYHTFFQQLPPKNQCDILQRWGKAETDPKMRQGRIMISGIRLGEIFVGIQPSRGYNLDVSANYHSPDLVPPHSYLAFYFWLRHVYQVDAMAHIGKHGNLEWLPGKSIALSQSCYPDLILGAMPHLYPFIVNDPGEGSQAKRRTQAVILDHLMPPMTQADSYGELAMLEQLVDEYYQASGLDKRREKYLKQQILQKLSSTNLSQELTVTNNDEETLNQLDAYLCELKARQIRHGLHIFGYYAEKIDDLLALCRLPRGKQPHELGLLHALAKDFKFKDFDPLITTTTIWQQDKPELLQKITQKIWRTENNTRERLELLAKEILTKSLKGNNPYPFLKHTYQLILYIKNTLFPLLKYCPENEIKQFIQALNGQFVPPGPSGAPTRGRLDVLPTGRNFYSVDTRAIPTAAAWVLGQASAEQLMIRHLQEHGDYPRTLGLSVWGTATMRTGGDDISQAFALMGVAPVWEKYSGRVIDVEIQPAMLIGRPRVDVTLRISGFFRDAFPNVVKLFDAAVQTLADYEDSGDLNPIRDHILQDSHLIEKTGLKPSEARKQAGWRVFGSKPGSYGAGLQGLIDERCWDDKNDLARAYVNFGGYAYDQKNTGIAAHAMFEHRLQHLEIIIQNQDNYEHDILDSDDYYQFQGGMNNAVCVLADKVPIVYHGDHSNPANPKIRTLQEELNRVIRSRVLNPKWIQGMQQHGYKGAFEMAATVDYLFAYDATTDYVRDDQYEQITDTLLFEPQNREFLQQNNPNAMQEIGERLLEAMQRELWQSPNEYKHKITDLLLDLDNRMEV